MQGAQLPPARRPHARRRRRVGLGQDDARPDAAAPARAERRPGRRQGDLRRPATCSRSRKAELLPMRKRIQVVFQNPYASLNPRFTIGQTLVEPMTIHGIGADDAARARGARARAARQGRPRRDGDAQVPARVLRRPAPARRDRALPDARPRSAGARRGGERARRLGAGAGAQPAEGPAGRARPGLHLHQPRPGGGALHGRRGHGDEGRRSRRAGERRSRSSTQPQQDYTRRLLAAIPRGYVPPPEGEATGARAPPHGAARASAAARPRR